MSFSDGQLGRSPHGGGIEKWAYVTLGNIKRGNNEWEFGTEFPRVHGWKRILSFGADISKRLLKIGGGWHGQWESFQILSEMAELSPRDSALRLFSSSEEDQEVT